MNKVFILCGGRGRRLEPLTHRIPKPLVQLNGKPILEHIIEFYIRQSFSQFVLCTGYKSEMIEKFVSKNKFRAEIEISNLGENTSILQRLYAVRHLIDDLGVVTYGDTYIDLDVR